MPPASHDDSTPCLLIPPPPGERIDRFGLPTSWTLMCDNTAEREAALADLVREVFKTGALHLGDDRARDLFAKTATGKKKRGRRPHDRLTDADNNLLAIYDARARGLTGRQLAALPRQIAEQHRHNSVAVQKRLRRALQHRAAAHAQIARHRVEEIKRTEEYRRRFGPSLLDLDYWEPDGQ